MFPQVRATSRLAMGGRAAEFVAPDHLQRTCQHQAVDEELIE